MKPYWSFLRLTYKAHIETKVFFGFCILFAGVSVYFLQSHLGVINRDYINWIDEVIAPVVGNIHLLMILFSPAFIYLLFSNFFNEESRYLCHFLKLDNKLCFFVTYFVALLMSSLLLSTFLPLSFYLEALGFSDLFYLYHSLFVIFLLSSVFCSMSVYILSWTQNPLLYLSFYLLGISYFYLIGLLSNYVENYVLVSVLRYLSFAVLFDDTLTGILSLKKIIYLLSLNLFFLSLAIGRKVKNFDNKEVMG